MAPVRWSDQKPAAASNDHYQKDGQGFEEIIKVTETKANRCSEHIQHSRVMSLRACSWREAVLTTLSFIGRQLAGDRLVTLQMKYSCRREQRGLWL